MSRVAGIATLENAKGEITHVTIDVKKHREVMTPILYQLGIIEESKFMKDFENGLTIEEARKSSHEFIKELWKRKS